MIEAPKGILIVTRHGTSQGNVENRWTGIADPPLAYEGFVEARSIAHGLQKRGIGIDLIYTSKLRRAIDTARVIEQEYVSSRTNASVQELPTVLHRGLNERSVGIHTWRVKQEVIDEIGQEAYDAMITDWTQPIPGGESLDDVLHRTVPILDHDILPKVRRGKNVLLVVHNNVIRATDRHLRQFERESREEKIRMENGETSIYQFASNGSITHHETLMV